jgi:hercynine metabolism protein
MNDNTHWLEELEAELERRLEAFLRANPRQEALLADQEARDRQNQLRSERIRLQQDARQQRQALLDLVDQIRQWQGRVAKARAAGAEDLAVRAESHITELMDGGRRRWQTLGELGQRFETVEQELNDLASRPQPPRPTATSPADLEADWAAFEARQELQELRRRMRL